VLQTRNQTLREEICLEDKCSASYKIKIPPTNQDAEDEEQIETEIVERKCSLYHNRPETLEVLASPIESSLKLISRNLKAERRNNNETSGLKTSPRKEVQHRKKMTYTCDLCGIRIKFDSSVQSPKGRAIPLEMDGSLHNCPYKEPTVENFGLPSRQYAKRQPRHPQRQHQQLSSLFYNEQQQHQVRDIYEKIDSLETDIVFLHDAFRELAKGLTAAPGEPKNE
jgi:hypothetical protein